MMPLLIIGGALAFGVWFVGRNKAENSNLLPGSVPNSYVTGENDQGFTPPETNFVRPGPSTVRPSPGILNEVYTPPRINPELFTVQPQPPTNTVQITALFATPATVVAPVKSPSITAVSSVPAKTIAGVLKIVTPAFAPPKGSVTPMTTPLTSGQFSSTVKAVSNLTPKSVSSVMSVVSGATPSKPRTRFL